MSRWEVEKLGTEDESPLARWTTLEELQDRPFEVVGLDNSVRFSREEAAKLVEFIVKCLSESEEKKSGTKIRIPRTALMRKKLKKEKPATEKFAVALKDSNPFQEAWEAAQKGIPMTHPKKEKSNV